MVLAANEAKLNPKMIGGAMVGLQSTVFKTKLGPALNGYMNYDFWLPTKSLMFKGTAEFMAKYQERAAKAAVDPLGYCSRRLATRISTCLARRSRRPRPSTMPSSPTTSARPRSRPLSVTSLGKGGEWAKSRVFQAQFRGIKGNGVDQFKNPETLPIITPAEYKSGDVIYPFEKARQ